MLPVTGVVVTRTVPAPRPGGAVRRFVLLTLRVVSWAASLVFLSAAISPSIDQPTGAAPRLALVALSAVLLALPVVVLVLASRRRVERFLAAVLSVTAGQPTRQLPPYDAWGGPRPMFRRLMVSSYSYTAIPLLLLAGSAVTFGMFLAEPGAGGAFAGLAVVPMSFVLVTYSLPTRLTDGVRAGLEAGQVVPVRIDTRVDQKVLLGDAFMSWFDAILPDGQHVVLRTPVHDSWAADARGVVESPDLLLVVGRDGHQGLLLLPSRPADAVWLLGPVPQTRVPRSVLKAFDLPPTATY